MTFDSTEMRALAARRLRYAIAASVILHVLVLWPGTVRVLTKDTPPVLQATLRKPPQPAVEPAPPTPARAVARPQSEPAPAAALPLPRLAAPVLERSTPPSVPQSVAPPAVPALQAAPRSESAPTTAAATPTPSAAGGSLLTEANASGEVVDGLRGYRLAVASQARRFKRYPAQAMASGWEGSAEIRVEVGSDGRPRTATVARSSGHELLDRAALAMIDAGALRARLPESLRGKAFAVVLPVVFNLDDQ